MSLELDRRLRNTGTKFRLHAQTPVMQAFTEPETVWVSSPAGSLRAGPADERMYVVDAIDKTRYEDGSRLPYRGPRRPPAQPGPNGHFDHLSPDDDAFRSAHIFGTVRRVLDIWEDYFGRTVPWHFSPLQERLEIVPWLDWNNAHFGWGFMEAGHGKDDAKAERPFALNFDVLAHETGHGLIFSMVGVPEMHALTSEFRGFHESASDLVALISVLHFDSFIDHLLNETNGNLYVENELNRIGELSKTRQIRVASNALKMSDVPDPGRPPNSLTGKEIHQLGEPLTGALFDTLVGIYQMNLGDRGAISPKLAADSSREGDQQLGTGRLQDLFAAAYQKSPDSFRLALAEARDIIGLRLARTWDALIPNGLHFAKVAKTFLTVDRQISGWRHQEEIVENFAWREIGYGYPMRPSRDKKGEE
ncbi:MAG: hypothetical protein ACR2P3_10815 [Geminicoccaceae bacterium]